MHAQVRASAAPPPRDLFAAAGAFLTRHALGAHPANYAFAFAVVSAPDSDLAQEAARIEEGGFRLTADDIERLGGEAAPGAPIAPGANAGERAEAVVERARDQVEGFTRTVRDIRDETRGFGDDLAATIALRSQLRALDDVTALTTTMIERVRQAEVRLETATCEAEALRQELEQARGDARRDPLTGLLNRRAFDEAFAARPAERTVAVAICDVDRFKTINDMFGHAVGDRVLRAVGRTIAEECQGCVTARYGGEEFVVLLPGDDPVEVVERARRRVAGRRFRLRDTDALLGTITFSAGLARIEAGEPLDAALARADTSLYLAKANGRNQVQIAD